MFVYIHNTSKWRNVILHLEWYMLVIEAVDLLLSENKHVLLCMILCENTEDNI